MRSTYWSRASLLTLGLAVGSGMVQPGAVQAEMVGSYVGVTVDGDRAHESLEEMVKAGDHVLWMVNEVVGGRSSQAGSAPTTQLQGRIDVPNSRVSVRGTVYVSDEIRAAMPTLSYDMPVGNATNLYAGAGYAIVRNPGQNTPLGDRNGIVLTTGAETAIGQNMVVYGDIRFRPNTTDRNTNPVRFQFGIGHRF